MGVAGRNDKAVDSFLTRGKKLVDEDRRQEAVTSKMFSYGQCADTIRGERSGQEKETAAGFRVDTVCSHKNVCPWKSGWVRQRRCTTHVVVCFPSL
jgi:hypothetical protein